MYNGITRAAKVFVKNLQGNGTMLKPHHTPKTDISSPNYKKMCLNKDCWFRKYLGSLLLQVTTIVQPYIMPYEVIMAYGEHFLRVDTITIHSEFMKHM